MTSPDQLTADRDDFRRQAVSSGAEAARGNIEAANAHTEAADHIVERWTHQVTELLHPLLDDPAAEVRFAASAHLLHHGDADHAVPVLEQIEADPEGLLAPTARLLLRRWHRHQHADT